MNRKIQYFVLILLASIASAASFDHFRQPVSMLVLQIKTFEKGVRRINVVDANGGIHEKRFEIGNDLGEPSFYTINLPRVAPREIVIDPLAGRGRFEIDKITLRNDEISYIWDSQGICTSKKLHNGVLRQDSCPEGQLLLKMSDNLQLAITGIPSTGYGIHLFQGIIAGVIGFLAVILAAFWVWGPVKPEKRVDKAAVYLSRGVWLVFLALYLAQLSAIWHYSIDIPFWEEWEYFLPEGLPKGLSWDWLFSFAGYHRVVPTKLMAWLNLQLFGLDFKLQKLFNYFIFAGLLAVVISLKNRVIGRNEFVLFPAFMLFMLSPIMYENHANSYQSQIHLLIIFALLALFQVYADGLRVKTQALFLLSLVAAINTFSAGMTIAAVFLPCWAMYLIAQIVSGQAPRPKGLMYLLGGGAVIATVAVSWISGYRQPSDCVWISPFSGLFWDTFLNLLSFGFGFEMEHPLPGVICLLVIIAPLIMLWSNDELRRQKRVWQLTTGIFCILAIIATISITRGNFVGTSKISRYVEFGLILIPLTSIAWWMALRHTVHRYAALLLLWGACIVSFADDWSYAPYRDGGQMDRFVLETLEEYVVGRGDGAFPWSHPKPLPQFFEGARQLDVKFTRQFKGL